jgi:hypothetical protein
MIVALGERLRRVKCPLQCKKLLEINSGMFIISQGLQRPSEVAQRAFEVLLYLQAIGLELPSHYERFL